MAGKGPTPWQCPKIQSLSGSQEACLLCQVLWSLGQVLCPFWASGPLICRVSCCVVVLQGLAVSDIQESAFLLLGETKPQECGCVGTLDR